MDVLPLNRYLFILFIYLFTLLIFRLKELFQVKNGLTTSLLFIFFENAQNLGRSDDAKRRKIKRMALSQLAHFVQCTLRGSWSGRFYFVM